MARLVLTGAVVACAALPMVWSGSVASTDAQSSRVTAMQFELRREGPAENCGDKCRTWVSASGAISADTARDFENFARGRDLKGMTIVLDSVGGSVVGALALGRSIRRLDMTTTVGKTVPLAARGKDVRATLSTDASCESMCAFVLLAGNRRYVPPEATLLVHQIWLGDRRDDAIAASYSAEDLMIVQRDIGRIAQYTIEMGGAIDLLETALRIPPWEPMRALSYDEIQRMRLSTVENAFERAPAAEPTVTASIQPTTVAVRAAGISERGWSVIEQSGQPVIARRHPMTTEGEEIGNFDLMFACGDSADTFNATYVDRRRSRDVNKTLEPLKEVRLSVGQRAATLKAAAGGAAPSHIQTTVATGPVPAAMVRAMVEGGSRTLTVAALSADHETIIRVGNTGFAQHFPQLANACAKQGRPRSNLRASVIEIGQ